MNYFKKIWVIFIIVFIITSFSSCSINRMATRALSNSLGEAGMAVFSRDDDPQLVKDSFPFVLKLFEILIENDPRNHELKATAGQLFIIYSNLFVHIPADKLGHRDWRKQAEMRNRARNLYMRGANYLRESLEIKYRINIDFSDVNSVEHRFRKEDAGTLYWLGAGLMSAITIDITNPALAIYRDTAIRIMSIAYELDPDFGDGALHEYFIMFYASMPESMGGSLEKARYHYKRALELSAGRRISPHIAFATTVATRDQTGKGLIEFREALQKAISFDVNQYPLNRLENTINRQRAIWLLNNIENFFLIDDYLLDNE
ncbi:MAG: TRAP transporter TatT component family protein [Spirochaetes bacterium]|nr:TRAP transporter TatT component family protein [Spirochaetota bacterium]